MPAAVETKQAIVNSLAGFAAKPLAGAATAFFESLGYRSQKCITLKPNSPDTFVATFAKDKPLNPDQALLPDWQSVDFLFQLTDDEVRAAADGDQQFLFDSRGTWDGAAMESYLFFAITLAKPRYTRTELSGITRAVNRLFPMPAMLLFRHGDTLTLAVINRRLHKRDEARDVLDKVTLIKDIRFANPHRAHVEILSDLSFDALQEQHHPSNFKLLHDAWQKTLDISELNKRFYQEVANWYFWALDNVHFPKDAPKDTEGRDAISLICLLTRLIFCWFIKEKGLIPDAIFNERTLAALTKGFAPRDNANTDSVYYKAILQNLFFATLNTEMDAPAVPATRRFSRQTRDDHMIHTAWRHERLLADKSKFQALFKDIPFLNGGLFECLDDREGELRLAAGAEPGRGKESGHARPAHWPSRVGAGAEFAGCANYYMRPSNSTAVLPRLWSGAPGATPGRIFSRFPPLAVALRKFLAPKLAPHYRGLSDISKLEAAAGTFHSPLC